MTSDRQPRLFTISFPVFDCYFSGTGDMFAALMVARIREAISSPSSSSSSSISEQNSDGNESISEKRSWLSGDDVDVLDLPLARAAEKVLASMHEVLAHTAESMTAEMATVVNKEGEVDEKTLHLLKSRASELKLVRNLGCLRDPTIEYRAEKM